MYVLDAAGVFAALVVYFINCYFASIAPSVSAYQICNAFLHEFTF